MKTMTLWIVGSLAGIMGVALIAQQVLIAQVAEQEQPVFMVVCFDVSNSGTEEDKLRYGQMAMRLIRSLDPQRDRLLLLRYDRETIEIGSEIPLDLDAFTFVLREAILRPSTTKGTRPAVLFDHIDKALSTYDLSGSELRVIVMTDGGNDDFSSEMEELYTESVSKLTSINQLRQLVFWGVRDGLREGIRTRFEKLDSQGLLKILGSHESLR